MKYGRPLTILTILAVSAGSIYAYNIKTPEQRLIESIRLQNVAIDQSNTAKIDSYRAILNACQKSASGTSREILQKYADCSQTPKPILQEYVGSSGSIEGVNKGNNNVEESTATGSVIPEAPSQSKCSIGTGSHDVRPLAYKYTGVAGWKNNNPSGITLGSKALEKEFDNANILWFVGSARPANEKSFYYGFPDLENGMKAKILIIKRSYKNSTVKSYLKIWGTDSIDSDIDRNRIIGDLSDTELLSIIKSQIKKESGSLSDYIFNKIIICKK